MAFVPLGWVTSLSTILLSSIYLPENFMITFIFTAKYYSNCALATVSGFIYQSVEGYAGCFYFIAIVIIAIHYCYRAVVNMTDKYLWGRMISPLAYVKDWYMSRSSFGIAKSCSWVIFSSQRIIHIDFQSSSFGLRSHQRGLWVPLPPHPLQRLLSLVRWNLKVVLISIFLTTKDDELFWDISLTF